MSKYTLLISVCLLITGPLNSPHGQSVKLSVTDGRGWIGSGGNIVSVDLENSVAVDSVRFKLLFDTNSFVEIDDLCDKGLCQIENGSFCVVKMPDISLSSPSLDFGNIPVGWSSNKVLTLWNVGECCEEVWNLIIASAFSDHPDFSVPSPTFPQVIPPGECIGIVVTFTPSTEGPVRAILTILANDPDEPTLQIPLPGYGVLSYVSIPDVCDASGDSVLASIDIYNVTPVAAVQVDLIFDVTQIMVLHLT